MEETTEEVTKLETPSPQGAGLSGRACDLCLKIPEQDCLKNNNLEICVFEFCSGN